MLKPASVQHLIVVLILLLSHSTVKAQYENVPLSSDVYGFLKDLSVARVITGYQEADPNKTLLEVQRWLEEANRNRHRLSTVATERLDGYLDDFFPGRFFPALSIFSPEGNFSLADSIWFPSRRNYLWMVDDSLASLYSEALIHSTGIHETGLPRPSGAAVLEVGFRINGTFLNHLGYELGLIKGMGWGPSSTLKAWDPRLNYNFKFWEKHEYMIVKNYDFTSGYLQWGYSPVQDLFLSVQVGREPTSFGLGYGSKLVLSGTHPDLDFLKFRVRYKQFTYHSIHASTVGDFFPDRRQRYTKYIVHHRFQWNIPDLMIIGGGESVVYHRSLDLGYLSPLSILKFTELSLQDRDNNFFFADFQTHAWDGFQLQGTLLMDESLFFNLPFPDRYSNKIAAQIGFWWYEPAGLQNLAIVSEYSWIRPFVYSHWDRESNYLAWGWPLGHRIGPNADEWLVRFTYDFSALYRLETEYRLTRKGLNVYSAVGDTLFNAGADPTFTYREGTDKEFVGFLDGNLNVSHELLLKFRAEIVADQNLEAGFSLSLNKRESDTGSKTYGVGFIRYVIDW